MSTPSSRLTRSHGHRDGDGTFVLGNLTQNKNYRENRSGIVPKPQTGSRTFRGGTPYTQIFAEDQRRGTGTRLQEGQPKNSSVDVRFMCEDGYFYAHRTILMNSQFFYSLILPHMNLQMIDLVWTDWKVRPVKAVITAFYRGFIPLWAGCEDEIKKFADMIGFTNLNQEVMTHDMKDLDDEEGEDRGDAHAGNSSSSNSDDDDDDDNSHPPKKQRKHRKKATDNHLTDKSVNPQQGSGPSSSAAGPSDNATRKQKKKKPKKRNRSRDSDGSRNSNSMAEAAVASKIKAGEKRIGTKVVRKEAGPSFVVANQEEQAHHTNNSSNSTSSEAEEPELTSVVTREAPSASASGSNTQPRPTSPSPSSSSSVHSEANDNTGKTNINYKIPDITKVVEKLPTRVTRRDLRPSDSDQSEVSSMDLTTGEPPAKKSKDSGSSELDPPDVEKDDELNLIFMMVPVPGKEENVTNSESPDEVENNQMEESSIMEDLVYDKNKEVGISSEASQDLQETMQVEENNTMDITVQSASSSTENPNQTTTGIPDVQSGQSDLVEDLDLTVGANENSQGPSEASESIEDIQVNAQTTAAEISLERLPVDAISEQSGSTTNGISEVSSSSEESSDASEWEHLNLLNVRPSVRLNGQLEIPSQPASVNGEVDIPIIPGRLNGQIEIPMGVRNGTTGGDDEISDWSDSGDADAARAGPIPMAHRNGTADDGTPANGRLYHPSPEVEGVAVAGGHRYIRSIIAEYMCLKCEIHFDYIHDLRDHYCL